MVRYHRDYSPSALFFHISFIRVTVVCPIKNGTDMVKYRIYMKLLPENLAEFKTRILADSYYPTTPLDTLKARLIAASLLQSNDKELVGKATALIVNTSRFKEDDLKRLVQFSTELKSWDELEICSAYANTYGSFLEYKLSFTLLNEQKQQVHYHALYKTENNHCIFVSQTPPLIRLTGDPVLQRPGILFPEAPTPEQEHELARQIELAKRALIQTSGAGIAANQCAAIKNPYCFTIVGIFHDIPEHVDGVAKRYPNTEFPEAKIMVNPVITAKSTETQQFNHACLSVPCPNKCAVKSPLEMVVKYRDHLDDMREKEEIYRGTKAVVLWHEYMHIGEGKTYMDVTFESLPPKDLVQFQEMLAKEIRHRHEASHAQIPELTASSYHVTVEIYGKGKLRLNQKELTEVLPKMSEDTLTGLFTQAGVVLKKKGRISDESWVNHFSVFSVGKERMEESDDGILKMGREKTLQN